jgi:lipopolysaccharide transport system ATP-binding protein
MSDAEITVRAEGLSKRYRVGAAMTPDASLIASAARGILAPARNLRHLRSLRKFRDEAAETDVIWALQDVSFELRRGDVLGVVGRNGAGKSTLLKVLARITEPTRGRAELRGRVASLLEVGTGFHPDLTGRENIYLKGTMLGMSRRDVDRRFDEIVEFAEIAKFLDTPVKRYSSGMYVRLAFSVAAHVDPDVLIADEVLAVGDAEFQRKCITEMREVADGGRTVIFVSHSHSLVSALCNRAIFLEGGRLRQDGDVSEVLETYADSLQEAAPGDVASRTDRWGTTQMRVSSAQVRRRDGRVTTVPVAGEPVELVIGYQGDGRPLSNVVVTITAETLLREPVFMLSNRFTLEELQDLPDEGELVCALDDLPLNQGDYMLRVRLEVDGRVTDLIGDVARFHVDSAGFFPSATFPDPGTGGPLLVRHRWSTRPREGATADVAGHAERQLLS